MKVYDGGTWVDVPPVVGAKGPQGPQGPGGPQGPPGANTQYGQTTVVTTNGSGEVWAWGLVQYGCMMNGDHFASGGWTVSIFTWDASSTLVVCWFPSSYADFGNAGVRLNHAHA